jgi:hypothetical protein
MKLASRSAGVLLLLASCSSMVVCFIRWNRGEGRCWARSREMSRTHDSPGLRNFAGTVWNRVARMTSACTRINQTACIAGVPGEMQMKYSWSPYG